MYGVVDSITCPDSPSFLRYQYPSTLPPAVTDRMAELSRRVIRQVGLDGITFNIEYFWDADRDAITLLEINPRHSQSHAELFERVDGVANHHCMLQLALGREPRPPHRAGRYPLAAKWFVRRTGRRRGPPGAQPRGDRAGGAGGSRAAPWTSGCRPGDRLSELPDQDSFSYELAHVYVGADDEEELQPQLRARVAGLPFEFDDRPAGARLMRFVDPEQLPHRVHEDTRLRIPMSDGAGWPAGSGGRSAPTPGRCRRCWSSSRTASAT